LAAGGQSRTTAAPVVSIATIRASKNVLDKPASAIVNGRRQRSQRSRALAARVARMREADCRTSGYVWLRAPRDAAIQLANDPLVGVGKQLMTPPVVACVRVHSARSVRSISSQARCPFRVIRVRESGWPFPYFREPAQSCGRSASKCVSLASEGLLQIRLIYLNNQCDRLIFCQARLSRAKCD
jgi:hypothetical protein